MNLKHQILSLFKAAGIAAGIAFIQAIEADAPAAWMAEPWWPVIGAVLTFAIAELGRLTRDEE